MIEVKKVMDMNRIDRSKALQKKYFKTEIVKEDPGMQNIMADYLYGEIYEHGALDFVSRELITLAVMAAHNGGDLMKDHVQALLANGVSALAIREAVYQAIPYAGILSVRAALPYVQEALRESGRETYEDASQTSEEDRFVKGFEAQCSVFPREVIQGGHDQAPDDLKHMQKFLSAHCFGDFYTRSGLTMKQRELLTFCVIASLGGCENQLRAHAGANLTAGNDRSVLLEAITQIQPYIGFPRTLNAINIIREVTEKD